MNKQDNVSIIFGDSITYGDCISQTLSSSCFLCKGRLICNRWTPSRWLYSEGQLSTEIAAKSIGLTIEEFLDRYEDYKG